MGASVLDMSALRASRGQTTTLAGSSSSAAGSDGSLNGSMSSYEGGTGGVRRAQGLRVGVPEALAGLFQSSSKLQTLLGGGAAALNASASGAVYPQSPTHNADDSRSRGRTLSSGNNSKVQLGAFSDDNDDEEEEEEEEEEDYDDDNNDNEEEGAEEGLLLDGDVTGSQDPQAELRARFLASSMQPALRAIPQAHTLASLEPAARGLNRQKSASSINDTTLESYFEASLDEEVPEF